MVKIVVTERHGQAKGPFSFTKKACGPFCNKSDAHQALVGRGWTRVKNNYIKPGTGCLSAEIVIINHILLPVDQLPEECSLRSGKKLKGR